MNIKEKIKQNKWNILIILIYAVITFLVTIIFHEKWRDEAQAWLIARDLDIIGIIRQMSYEGHPPLWYFILFPFAKMGAPYITESIISWGIMVFTSWVILIKSPFKKPIQILILLSAPFLYWYPAISRSYCLIPLALVLISIYYPERKQKPIQYSLSILFLAYTHIIMLGLVGILYLFFFFEHVFEIKKDKENIKKFIISIIIAIVGLLCLLFMLFTSTGKNDFVSISKLNEMNFIKVKAIINVLESQLFGIASKNILFKVFFWSWCMVLVIIGIKKEPKSLLSVVISIAWQLFIYFFIYISSEQRINSLILIGMMIAWINHEKLINHDNIKIVFSIGCITLMVLNIIFGIANITEDFKKDYSSAKKTAEFIQENIDMDAIFVCTDGPIASAIIPYVKNMKFWNPSSEEYFTYVTLNQISKIEMTKEDIIKKAKKNFLKEKNVYILDCNNKMEGCHLKQVYKSEQELIRNDENYIIYDLQI